MRDIEISLDVIDFIYQQKPVDVSCIIDMFRMHYLNN